MSRWRATVAVSAVAWASGATVVSAVAARLDAEPIDRKALVSRHDPVLRGLEVESPLSVGNGEFAFTADVTGLQTFAEGYEKTIPLGTLAQWGWHSWPNPEGWSIDRFGFTEFESYGRRVGYADIPGNKRTPEIEWLRANPHRLHLGRIGLHLLRGDGTAAEAADLTDVEQRLDLWNGTLRSRFKIEGAPVEVTTIVHPTRDALTVRVASPLMARGRIGVSLRFPYGTSDVTTADWTKPEAHTTRLRQVTSSEAVLLRTLDADAYRVALRWMTPAALREIERHRFLLAPSTEALALELVAEFLPGRSAAKLESPPPAFAEVERAVRDHWNGFWASGGAIDLSGSTDPRWRELERRVVLSQYLTAIQCAGSNPPQESGLTFNSWGGKFHLEMHWWHAVHFALWGRLDRLEKSLGFYERILPRALGTARRQGYTGARWPKMTDPFGAESPSSVGPFLVWQQPHPIYYAELVRRTRGDRAALERYRDVVFETAEFMASFAAWDESTRRYVLGPPLQCAQEVFPKDRTFDCTFELVYWRWGLETAQRWRERLGLAREPKWQRVLDGLSRPLAVEGKYAFAESVPDSFADPRWAKDHPAVTASLGMLPGPGIDRETMRRTLDWIWARWDWPDTWGWDYPMLAMCAARLDQPERAVDALLLDTPKNVYRTNGHNHQRPGLTIYLPGNGGLLTAVAMMAAGWDGGPKTRAPGFPRENWRVRYEGLHPLP